MMSCLDGGVVQRRSRYGGSNVRRKRITWGKIDDFIDDCKTSRKPRRPLGPAPANALALGHNGLCCDAYILEIAEIAVSSLNEKSRAKQGAEYELVKAVNCIQFRYISIYHCNFIARPKNGSEAENKLFFAEIKCEVDPDGNGKDGPYSAPLIYSAHFCYNLGPSDTKTGLGGCNVCVRYPSLIQHPEEEFTKFDVPVVKNMYT